MKMKNEDVSWQPEALAEALNERIRNVALPHEFEFEDIRFNQDDLLEIMYKLEKIGALKILRLGSRRMMHPDVYSNEPDFDLLIFNLRVNRKILEEDYRVLSCGNLTFNLATGLAIYKKKVIITVDTKQYKLLKFFMLNQNTRLSYEEIAKVVGYKWNTTDIKNPDVKEKIKTLVRDTKKVIGMLEKDKMIVSDNGYRLNCP